MAHEDSAFFGRRRQCISQPRLLIGIETPMRRFFDGGVDVDKAVAADFLDCRVREAVWRRHALRRGEDGSFVSAAGLSAQRRTELGLDVVIAEGEDGGCGERDGLHHVKEIGVVVAISLVDQIA